MNNFPYINGREIYEVANQLEGYVDEGTSDHLATFLMREGKAASDLADEIVRLNRILEEALEVIKPFYEFIEDSELFPVGVDYDEAHKFYKKYKVRK